MSRPNGFHSTPSRGNRFTIDRTSRWRTGRRSVAFHRLTTADSDLAGETPHECIGNSRRALIEPTEGSALHRVITNRRAQLWEEEGSLSLELALRRYCIARRTASKLAHFLSFESDGFATDLILRPHQQRALVERLDELQLVGPYGVSERFRGGAGQSIRLRLTGNGADRQLVLPPSDARWCSASPIQSPPPPLSGFVGPGQVTTADALPFRGTAGCWSHVDGVSCRRNCQARTMRRRRPSSGGSRSLLLASSWPQRHRARREPHRADGTPRLPIQNALLAPSLMGGYIWEGLSSGQKVSLASGAATTIGVGGMALARPRPLGVLAVNMVSANLAAWLGGRAYRRQIDLDLEREMKLIHDVETQAERTGRRTGAPRGVDACQVRGNRRL